MRIRHLLWPLLAALLVACAVPNTGPVVGAMLAGKMYSLKDGTELHFEIQTSYGTGDMTAYDPSNGESFRGQYTGIYKGGSASTGVYRDAYGFSTGSVTTQAAPTGASARGILRGDKGRIINVQLDIQPGARPRGFGEGVDNQGVKYQIQF